VGDSPLLGSQDAPVTITLFSRFNQKSDKALFRAVVALQKASPDTIRVLFKHRPGSDKAAKEAAIASMAAQMQGQFWPYAEKLFSGKRGLQSDALFFYAEDLGMDLSGFREAVNDPLLPVRINADDSVAVKMEASSAPAIYFNGRAITPHPNALVPALKQEMQQAQRLTELGVPDAQLSALLTELHLLSPPIAKSTTKTRTRKKRPSPESDKTIHAVSYEEEHLSMGAKEQDALITVVVFNDYQCPFCKRLEPTLAALVDKYPGILRVVYRHNPLPMHPAAKTASTAAIAAHIQKKGFQYHERIFSQPRKLAETDLLAIARDLKLNIKQFGKDRLRAAETIQKDMRDAQSLKATGTPTSFLNGRRITGAKALSTFVNITEQELERAKKLSAEKKLRGPALYKALTSP